MSGTYQWIFMRNATTGAGYTLHTNGESRCLTQRTNVKCELTPSRSHRHKYPLTVQQSAPSTRLDVFCQRKSESQIRTRVNVFRFLDDLD